MEEQYTFRADRSCLDNTFIVQQLVGYRIHVKEVNGGIFEVRL